MSCLNPYCSGQWSRTQACYLWTKVCYSVLILIVVDNGLVPSNHCTQRLYIGEVLILIVVDNSLVPIVASVRAYDVNGVLILIVVDNSLVQRTVNVTRILSLMS